MLGDLAAKDHRDLLRLSDGSIGVEQTLAELVQGRATAEDEVVAEFDLREEQSVSATSLFSLSCGEKGCEGPQPLLTATRSRGMSELASACRRSGAAHVRKALASCLNLTPLSRRRLASHWC